MTDNEIIKALKSYKDDIGCMRCGVKDNYLLTTIKNALDLINRQQAEIERLEAQHREMCIGMKVLKKKAIEKFAEELEYFVLNEDVEIVKPKCKDYESYFNGANQFRHQIKNGINSLVKGRTEVETNQRKEDEGK